MGKSHETVSDQQFIEAWKRLKGATAVAKELGISTRAAYNRRRSIEGLHRINLDAD